MKKVIKITLITRTYDGMLCQLLITEFTGEVSRYRVINSGSGRLLAHPAHVHALLLRFSRQRLVFRGVEIVDFEDGGPLVCSCFLRPFFLRSRNLFLRLAAIKIIMQLISF